MNIKKLLGNAKEKNPGIKKEKKTNLDLKKDLSKSDIGPLPKIFTEKPFSIRIILK